MNTYIVKFGPKKQRIEANDILDAKQKALALFNIPKEQSHLVSVMVNPPPEGLKETNRRVY